MAIPVLKSTDLIRDLEQAGLRRSAPSPLNRGRERQPSAQSFPICPAVDGKAMPSPKPMSDWRADREYKGWTWGIVDVPVERLFGPAAKINTTVPGRLFKQIEEQARAHGQTRSGLLTKAALEAMPRA